MNKTLILVLLLSAVLAGGVYKSNKIILERGKTNSIDFACGQQDNKGSANVLNRNYIYDFSNLPNWLRFANGRLTGLPPASATGPWTINVNYKGNTAANQNEKGTAAFSLCFADQQAKVPAVNLSNMVFLKGLLSGLKPVSSTSAGAYVVLYPFIGNLNAIDSLLIPATNNPFGDLIANLTKQCDSVKAAITAAEANVTSITADYSTAQVALQTAQKNLAALIQKRKNLQARDGVSTADLDAQIADLQAKLAVYQTNYDNAKLVFDNDTYLIQDTQRALDAANANLTDLKQKKSDFAATAAENLQKVQAELQAAQQKLSQDSAQASQAQAAFNDANSQSDSVRAEAAAAADRLAKAKAELEAAQKAQDDVAAKQTQVDQAIQAAKSALDTAQAAVTADNQAVATSKSDVDNANAATQSNPFDDDVEEAAATVATVQTRFADAQQKQQTDQAAVTTADAAVSSTKAALDAAQTKRDSIVLQNQNTKADCVAIVKDISTAQATIKDLQVKFSAVKVRLNQAKSYLARKKTEYTRCQQRLNLLPNANDGSCAAIATTNSSAGAGAVLSKDKNVLIIGNIKIYIGSCSEKQYAPGKNYFDVFDKVEYEGVRKGDTIWAKKVKCTCS